MSSTKQKDFRQSSRKYRLGWVAFGFLMFCCLVLLHLPLPQIPSVKANSTGIKIMPLGDSITFGEGSSTGGGYRLPLWKELRARGFPIAFVGSVQTGPESFERDNEGHPGWTIKQLAAAVVPWLLIYRPDIILLHIGTNDFIKNDDPAQAPIRLRQLLDLITATLPGARVIVAQILPLPLSARLNAEVGAYNAAIPTIVQAEDVQGKLVQYVDMYHAVSPSMLPDQIHPNDAGYALMAQVWLQALLPLLSRSKLKSSTTQDARS